MLQAIVLHSDLGQNPHLKDFVGVLSSHPFTICASLRVFGRGIESLPLTGDWEHMLSKFTHRPLRSPECVSLMEALSVNYVRNTKLNPASLSTYTDFFIDHTMPNEALRVISYGMNKQTSEPWQWCFGSLDEGCEYLCIL
jgi:hypothetical protein